MLWWMLLETIKITEDPRLKSLVEQYLNENFRAYYDTPWSKILLNSQTPIDVDQLLHGSFPPYNLHLIYGFTCDTQLADAPIIQAQNRSDFCPLNQPISPACFTHQMMAFRFMQRYQCDERELSAKVETVATAIRWQLRFDGRLVDVYLQRVLMLLDGGFLDTINPVWIARALSSQREDGGWGGFQPLISVSDGRYVRFTAKGLGLRKPISDFHATAQGVWLAALVLKQRDHFVSE